MQIAIRRLTALTRRRAALTLAAASLVPGVASAASYTYTDVSAAVATAAGGATVKGSLVYALNNTGTLLGDYTTSAGTTFFTYANGTAQPFPTVNGTQLSYPTQQPGGGRLINDAGLFGASGAVNTAEPSDGTTVGGYYNPTTSTYTQFPAATTYQTANQVATGIQPFAVNSTNVAVGTQYFQTEPTSQYPSSNTHGVIFNPTTGVTTDIGGAVLNSSGNATTGHSSLIGISDNNLIVGSANNGSINTAFLGTPNGSGGYTYADLTSLLRTLPLVAGGGTLKSAAATDISANGTYVIGTYAVTVSGSTQTRSFEVTNGTSAVDLGNPIAAGAYGVQADSVNDSGQVVGASAASSGSTAAFVYTPNGTGTATLANLNALVLNAPASATFTSALGINDAGQIVGYDAMSGGLAQNAYELTVAAPEPTSLALLAAGAVPLFARRRSATRT